MIIVKLERQGSLRQSRRKHQNLHILPYRTCELTMRVFSVGKMADAIYGHQGRKRSLYRNSFRENATNCLTFVARDSVFRTKRVRCLTDTHTHTHARARAHTHTDTTTTVTLAAHARRGLIICGLLELLPFQ